MTRQHLMTEGLILRDYPSVAETDRFVAILTRDKGVLRASARGAKNIKSRFGASTQLLCYSSLSLIPAGDKYILEDAKPKEVFFPLRQDVRKLALGQYFCELALHFCPTDAPAEEHLRLILNALYYLSTDKRSVALVKAVTEGRLMALEGYMPEMTGCAHCGVTESDVWWFSPSEGEIKCGVCAHSPDSIPVSAGVLTAMKHIFFGEFEKCFAFTLPAEELAVLGDATERFLLAQGQRNYTTLQFYHSVT